MRFFFRRLTIVALPIVSLAGCNSTTTALVERPPHQQFSWDGAGTDPNALVHRTSSHRKSEITEHASAGASEDALARRMIICRGCQIDPDAGRRANASLLSTINDGQALADRSATVR
jgi:hypothetical protein